MEAYFTWYVYLDINKSQRDSCNCAIICNLCSSLNYIHICIPMILQFTLPVMLLIIDSTKCHLGTSAKNFTSTQLPTSRIDTHYRERYVHCVIVLIVLFTYHLVCLWANCVMTDILDMHLHTLSVIEYENTWTNIPHVCIFKSDIIT